MKKLPPIRLSVALLSMALTTCSWAQAPGASAPLTQGKHYDFAYKINDRNIQVFDDGAFTSILLPEGTLVPTIIDVGPRCEELLTPRRKGTYLVVDGVHQLLALRWSGKQDVTVVYSGSQARTGQAASFGGVEPAAVYGSIGQPQQSGRHNRVDANDNGVIGPLETIVDEPISDQHTHRATANVVTWIVQPQDRVLSAALSRWAISSGLKFQWNPAIDLPVTATHPHPYAGDLQSALRTLFKECSSTGVKLTYELTPDSLIVNQLNGK